MGEDKEKYTRQFKRWDKCMSDNKAKSLEELYKKVHAAIVKDSDRKKIVNKGKKPAGSNITEAGVVVGRLYKSKAGSWPRQKKITREDKKKRVLRSMSKGRANYSMKLSNYDFVPP